MNKKRIVVGAVVLVVALLVLIFFIRLNTRKEINNANNYLADKVVENENLEEQQYAENEYENEALSETDLNEVVDSGADNDNHNSAVADGDALGAGEDDNYASLYLDFINTQMGERVDFFEFALIYINDDDIPELYYSGDCEASGSGVVYINPSNEADIVMMGRIAGCYKPRDNFFYHTQIHMGTFADSFYSFEDGYLVLTDYGYGEDEYDPDAIDADGNEGDFVYTKCYFNDEEVSAEDYFALINDKIADRELVDLEEWYFTKDGEPISGDEYWDHSGEDGYFGGKNLLTYEEMVDRLTELML